MGKKNTFSNKVDKLLNKTPEIFELMEILQEEEKIIEKIKKKINTSDESSQSSVSDNENFKKEVKIKNEEESNSSSSSTSSSTNMFSNEEKIEKSKNEIIEKIKTKYEQPLRKACRQSFNKIIPITIEDNDVDKQLGTDLSKMVSEHVDHKEKIDLFTKNFLFRKKQMKKKMENMLIFLKEVKNNLNKINETIIKNFSKFDKQKHFNEVSFSLKFLGGDSHKNGKSPLLVTLSENYENTDPLKVVYKPRLAKTDYLIIEMFKQLNQLKKKRSVCIDLPTYNILCFDDLDVSIWEYIEGEIPKSFDSQYIYNYIDSYINSLENKNAAKNQLKRLESVCKKIGVTDLHYENVLFVKKSNEFVPIDLEVIMQGEETWLYPKNIKNLNLPELNEKENTIINQCKEKLQKQNCRFLLLSTGNFISAYNYIFLQDKILKDTIKKLNKIKGQTLQENKVKKFFKEDMKKRDVPFFISSEGIIYYLSNSKKEKIYE
ncbi:MAG: hypothetical protein AMS24_04190 [Chlamydiae bacterium SM23_39]|nr:MAG: hypothetical protein AMS24_04190 [Chlamydiae bacterium SM23_39]